MKVKINNNLTQEIQISVYQHISFCDDWKKLIKAYPEKYKEPFLEVLESLEDEEFIDFFHTDYNRFVRVKKYKLIKTEEDAEIFAKVYNETTIG
jgi:hypothetical protein